MTHSKLTQSLRSFRSSRSAAALVIALVIANGSVLAYASQPKTFASADQAAQALYKATQSGNEKALRSILGAGPELTSSGNETEDKADRERFARKYGEMHRLVREPDGKTVLYVGAENWPFPVPLVQKSGKWQFDSSSGSREVMARQIGENEITAIEVCKTFGKAGVADVSASEDDASVQQFASTISSKNDANGTPFKGYYFRVARDGSGAAKLLAYPAEYRLSGVMSFVCASNGDVYEKDLGVQTVKSVQQIPAKPGKDWVLVQ